MKFKTWTFRILPKRFVRELGWRYASHAFDYLKIQECYDPQARWEALKILLLAQIEVLK